MYADVGPMFGCLLCCLSLVGVSGHNSMFEAVHFPDASEYPGQAVLSADEYELFWKLQPKLETISLVIHAKTAGCAQHAYVVHTI